MCDEIWVIMITSELAIERLLQRNNISKEEAFKRINVQLSTEERIKYAKVVIYNTSTLEELRPIISKEWKNLQDRNPNKLSKI